MTCERCQTLNPTSASYCRDCGQALPEAFPKARAAVAQTPAACLACGTASDRVTAYCTACGMSLELVPAIQE